MKNWKQFTFMAIIAIVGIIIGFVACNNDNETTHVHQWGDWTVTTVPTCSTEGIKTRVCTLDATHKETQPIAIDPNAHQWGEWTKTKDPSYTEDGEETRICAHNSAHKETRPIYERSFTIGAVSFLFEYSKDDTTSWAKLDPVIQNYITYITDPLNSGSVYEANITGLANREGANYKIIVDYSGEGKAIGFVATDWQTLTVGNEYIINATTFNRNTLRDAFGALLAKPYP